MTTTLIDTTEEKLKHLSDLNPGDSGIIDCLHFDDDYRQRLYSMGLRGNQTVTCIRKAVWEGPIHIRVNTTELFLRFSNAKLIHLK